MEDGFAPPVLVRDPPADGHDEGATPERDLAGALHEVSNALTVVVGWIERARVQREIPERVEQALAIASSRATQARHIARRAIGAEVADGAPRAIADVIDEAVLGLEPEARRAGVVITTSIDASAGAAHVAHADAIVQILTNLLLNAIAMSPRGSTVTVDAAPSEDDLGVVLGVTDQGPGIPLDRRRTLFTAGVSTRAGGAGIGLRHAAALARASGGELRLGDAAATLAATMTAQPAPLPEGGTSRGARFELHWPIASADGPRSAARTSSTSITPPRPRGASLDGVRILVVEDDDAVIDLLDTALSARGAEVIAIRRRSELDRALTGGPFDAALLDLSPVRADIRGVLSAIRAANLATQVILISGTAVDDRSFPAEWVSAWVRKPFEVAEIVDALRAARPSVAPPR